MTNDSIPITLIAGFLGAGKTTMLNRLLQGEHGYRIAVLVNDFGAINIDAELVETAGDQVVSLSNGCVCCTIRDDLLSTVWELLERPERPEYIVIEASGIADPSAIAFTFASAGRHEAIFLDAIVTVIDAASDFGSQEESLRTLMENQIQVADIIVLNKCDLVEAAELERRCDDVRKTLPDVPIFTASFGNIPAPLLLDIGARGASGDEPASMPAEGVKLKSWSYETNRRVESLRVLSAALRALPGGIFRVKGILQLQDLPDREIIVHRVGRRTDIQPGRAWSKTPRTRIVAIGDASCIDAGMLDAWFEQCLEN